MSSYLEQRILKISKKYNLSHIGSCLSAAGPIEAIYTTKKPDEPFILSNGHAALALYCVLERWAFGDAEKMYKKHGTHPNRDKKNGIWASTGSLGHGVGIAVGYALSNKNRLVYVLTSDGECAEACGHFLRQPGWLHELRGFASRPRERFAFIGELALPLSG